MSRYLAGPQAVFNSASLEESGTTRLRSPESDVKQVVQGERTGGAPALDSAPQRRSLRGPSRPARPTPEDRDTHRVAAVRRVPSSCGAPRAKHTLRLDAPESRSQQRPSARGYFRAEPFFFLFLLKEKDRSPSLCPTDGVTRCPKMPVIPSAVSLCPLTLSPHGRELL